MYFCSMKKILFVCHGNICRSPMAEFVMKKLVRTAGREEEYEIASAATSTEEIGNPVYPMARQELAKHGIGCPGKKARQITAEDFEHYDMIIGMDDNNMQVLRQVAPSSHREKLSMLLDYTDKPRDVADPWYTRDFRTAWNDIWEGCNALFDRLNADGGKTN